MLHGGDQVYADEVTQGHELSHDWPDGVPSDPSAPALADLRHYLRQRFFERYAALYAAPEVAWLAARVELWPNLGDGAASGGALIGGRDFGDAVGELDAGDDHGQAVFALEPPPGL